MSVFLIVLFCLGDECTTHRQKLHDVSLVGCFMQAQQAIVALMPLYPQYDIKSWRCEQKQEGP